MMKRTAALSKLFLAILAGDQPANGDKLAAEHMVSHGWLTRDSSGAYLATPKGRKALASAPAAVQIGEGDA